MRQGGTAAPDGFTEFVAARGPALHRTAMLLTHDGAAAEDLVQTALVKAWRHWARIDQPEAYVRRILVHQFASDRRRRWTGELPTDQPPEERAAGDHAGSVADQQDLLAGLAPDAETRFRLDGHRYDGHRGPLLERLSWPRQQTPIRSLRVIE